MLFEQIEADAQRCPVKKVFLEISQNSLENTSARVSFLIKLQAWGPKWTTVIFLVNLVKFLRSFFFSKHMWVAIFVSFNPVSKAREQLIPTYWSACVKYRDKQSNACLFVAKILGVAST